ncbi:hypothetical protein ARMSODRAFT_1034510 [Armillaria solidipes]|uniref:Uncharacterized protein n=1 Tax=Armillaria solidipes TaxID=1076256 RepID=A0A2H3B6K0_9AGAR|nr:hypothetical protein ARMSODRAFT_1034510 [Armillaria solidipes]
MTHRDVPSIPPSHYKSNCPPESSSRHGFGSEVVVIPRIEATKATVQLMSKKGLSKTSSRIFRQNGHPKKTADVKIQVGWKTGQRVTYLIIHKKTIYELTV